MFKLCNPVSALWAIGIESFHVQPSGIYPSMQEKFLISISGYANGAQVTDLSQYKFPQDIKANI